MRCLVTRGCPWHSGTRSYQLPVPPRLPRRFTRFTRRFTRSATDPPRRVQMQAYTLRARYTCPTTYRRDKIQPPILHAFLSLSRVYIAIRSADSRGWRTESHPSADTTGRGRKQGRTEGFKRRRKPKGALRLVRTCAERASRRSLFLFSASACCRTTSDLRGALVVRR